MKSLVILIALIFVGMYLNAQEDNCKQIYRKWDSEKEAIALIEKTSFTFSDLAKPSDESWLSSAHYYSCDEEYGFLIVKGDKKTFIHQDVPIAVWQAFKNAKSIGGYYNFYIKNKYKLDKKEPEISPL